MGARIYVEGGLGGIVVVIPVAVEVWMLSSWNDRGHVRLGRGSRTAVDYAWSHLSHRWERVPRLGAPVAPRLARGLDVSLGRGGSRPRGSDTFDDIMGARQGGKMPPEAPISFDTFSQGSGGMEFVVRATDD
jgi:hypothetical protein